MQLTFSIHLSIQAVRQTVRIVTIDHPQNLLRTGDRATVIFEFIAHPEFVKAGMKLLFREGKTKVEIPELFFWSFISRLSVQCVGSWNYHEASIKTASLVSVSESSKPYSYFYSSLLQSVFQSRDLIACTVHDVKPPSVCPWHTFPFCCLGFVCFSSLLSCLVSSAVM